MHGLVHASMVVEPRLFELALPGSMSDSTIVAGINVRESVVPVGRIPVCVNSLGDTEGVPVSVVDVVLPIGSDLVGVNSLGCSEGVDVCGSRVSDRDSLSQGCREGPGTNLGQSAEREAQ